MGLELELLSDQQLPPIRTTTTTRQTSDGAVDDDGCATPTSPANLLRAPSVCPPAPRKSRPPAKRRKHCGRRRWFVVVPHDLAAVFVARRPASTGGSPCRPPAGKKIRVHVVG